MRIFIFFSIVLCSCASIKKNKKSSTYESIKTDSSKEQSKSSWERVVTEKATAPYSIPADSISSSSYKTWTDTTTTEIRSTSDGMDLITKIIPEVKDGKIIGYKINNKASSKSKTIQVPIDRTVTSKGVAENSKQTGGHIQTGQT